MMYHPEWVQRSHPVKEVKRKYMNPACDRELPFSVHVDGTVDLKVDRHKIWSALNNSIYNTLHHMLKGEGISPCLWGNGE